MPEGSEVLPVPATPKPDVTVKKEPTIDEIQREIASTILERLQAPNAVNLEYPNEMLFMVAKHQANPDYEHGSRRRFLVLDRSPLLGTDQICITATDNRSQITNITQGAGLLQRAKGRLSSKEITLTRFVQTPIEKLKNAGTYYLLVKSENVTNFTGTLSKKGRAYPKRRYPPFAGKEGVAPFAQRWQEGDFQLAEVFHYDTSGTNLDFLESDYREILAALKTAKINQRMTDKVAASEEKFSLARRASPTALQPLPTAPASEV